MIPQGLYSALDLLKTEYHRSYPLSALSTFRVGGTAEAVVFPNNADELVRVIELCGELSVRYELIGRGSNVFFTDGLLSAVLIVTSGIKGIACEGERLIAAAGESLIGLSRFAAEKGLSGLEFASGIPGSLGGAVFMNAGAYGGEIKDVCVRSTAYDTIAHKKTELTEHCFDYRKSIYSQRRELVCLEAELLLIRGDKDGITQRMRDLTAERRAKQPLEYPSAGSYFKRPEGGFAAKLIDDCGLKGFRVGDAQISEKHAGFVINLGEATAAHLLTLEAEVRSRVLERFGIELEREVRFIE